MDHTEVVKLVRLVAAGWQNFRPGNIEETVAFWESVIGEYEFIDAALAVKTFASSNADGFPPNPGQLIEVMQKIKTAGAGYMTENEAWALVRKAIENSAYNYASEYEKLPDIVKRAVGSASMLQTWATDENFSDSVTQSQFLKCYRAETSRALEQERFPEEVKRLITKEQQKQLELTEARQALIGAGINFDDIELDEGNPLPMIHENEDGYETINMDEYRKWKQERARYDMPATEDEVAQCLKRFRGAMKE